MTINRVSIVSGGQMGSGVAHVCAVARVNALLLRRATNSLRSLERTWSAPRPKLSKGDRWTSRALPLLSDRDLVIEAVVDGLPVVQIGDY